MAFFTFLTVNSRIDCGLGGSQPIELTSLKIINRPALFTKLDYVPGTLVAKTYRRRINSDVPMERVG